MTRIFIAPSKYVQGPGILKELKTYTQNVSDGKVYLLVDPFIAEHYKDDILNSFSEGETTFEVFGGECSYKEIDRHLEIIGDTEYGAIVGIGGGKTLDTSKAVGEKAGLPTFIAPTAASSDAATSALSVVYTEEGEFLEYFFLSKNPSAVLMDEDIIVNAPARMFRSGIGDALATFYEADASSKIYAQTIAGGVATKAALELARLCLDTLLEDGIKAAMAVEEKMITPAVSNVIEANTLLSGLGFESGGLAGAHAVHNGMTVIEELHHLLHGEKVAFGTLTQMVLENRDLDEIEMIMGFCKQLELPTSFEELGIPEVTKAELLEVAKIANSPEDTMGNMGFEVTDEAIVGAMYTVDKLSQAMDA